MVALVQPKGVNLVDLDAFVRVVETGSLTGAAEQLGVPKSTVSRRVARLEDALGLPLDAITKGLAGFTDSPDENPGRGNYIEVGGLTLLIDYAHNPHGVLALADAVKSIPAKRRLVIAGQAGDRSDEDTQALIRALWTFDPAMVVTAELPHMLRGRQVGELTEVMSAELRRLGATDDTIIETDTEYSAVLKSLAWAQPGDFLALLIHEDRPQTMELLEKLEKIGWRAGEPLPA